VPYKLKWFQNQKFRAAISYAIDRNQMIQIVLNGLGSPQYSAMSSSSGLFFNPNVTTYDFNLEKSKRLLGQLILLSAKDLVQELFNLNSPHSLLLVQQHVLP
jgi:peptide/nickel transport system substrate-binding protein